MSTLFGKKVIEVNERGIDSKGNEYNQFAAYKMVEAGYFKNVPVILKYPNGKLEDANEVMVTKAGLEFLRREIPAELRHN